ncbi:hypothetical protein QF050_000387 [Arthrobacter sp. SLBN-112]|nr:hypothetical protein [Arthrobacter sp. SLBN-112]
MSVDDLIATAECICDHGWWRFIDKASQGKAPCTAAIAIASNESFSGWTKTFSDPRLCAAIVDRLTFNGTIIETGTDSYRLAHTIAQHNAS